nr:hypothetical protein L204_01092 [Cryptococcus depauperatus CBS 7855]
MFSADGASSLTQDNLKKIAKSDITRQKVQDWVENHIREMTNNGLLRDTSILETAATVESVMWNRGGLALVTEYSDNKQTTIRKNMSLGNIAELTGDNRIEGDWRSEQGVLQDLFNAPRE